MENDTVIVEQESGTVTAETEKQERTFTQAELDDIVKNRLAKERAKYGDYETLQQKALKFDEMEEANKSELQKATERADSLQQQLDAINHANVIRDLHDKVAKDTGVPASLLTGDTEEACLEQAYGILAYKNDNQPVKYPSVKDGGEVANIPANNKTNGQLFGEWLNTQLTN